MKKTIYFLFVFISFNLICSNPSYSQDYYPLTGEGKHWIVALPDEFGMGYYEGLWEYFMTGDTVIENKNYKKVFLRNLYIPEDMMPPFLGASEYDLFGAIREDSEERKVYAIRFLEWGWVANCGLNEEYLMYDFSVEVGETADFCTMIEPTEIVYIGESFNYSVPTRMFQPSGNIEYFEGIGSIAGLFELMSILVKNDYLQYPFLAYYCPHDDCDVLLGEPERVRSNSIKANPNPASDYFEFVFDHIEITEIQIYNLKGELIQELYGESKIQWNCESISSGIYFYKVISKSNIRSGKIIVQ